MAAHVTRAVKRLVPQLEYRHRHTNTSSMWNLFKDVVPVIIAIFTMKSGLYMQQIRHQYRPDHKQIAMPFSPIFDDAVLPQAFVFGLGHSCQARSVFMFLNVSSTITASLGIHYVSLYSQYDSVDIFRD
ncbi:hypothetical protein PAMA_003028 [Pampus argenteus]